ncbi:MAG: phenylacetate-CoA oxygenase subunit PaaJ [Betaproteobacteria bacterium]|jgi:ring-1,2-phenylacetyl-CoA epoxidase subunit PaaD|nr:phenylacetate-CoA oxygenase subunit PaaJ [Betaproteobacteria bacterium]
MAIDMAALHAALDQVCDPEIPVVSLREMGILREVHLTESGVEVVITPTYSGCPAMEQIHDDIASTLQRLGVTGQVTTQLAPAWTTDWMTPDAREKLKAYGIAPPSGHSASNPQVVRLTRRLQDDVVACPHCGSTNTTITSAFGSTACKALCKCLSCQEPFDYFKPY